MAKSKRRIAAAARRRSRKGAWKSMTSEQRAEFNERRARTVSPHQGFVAEATLG